MSQRTTGRTAHAHARILAQAKAMRARADLPAAELSEPVPAVSAWSVAQHLSHAMLVDRAIVGMLAKLTADGPEDKGGVSLAGRLVLATGWMPRGRGRATTPLLPRDTSPAALRAELDAHELFLADLAPRLPAIERAPGRGRHLVFGHLDSRQWLRFLGVHQHHHLKIVRDILRARPAAAPGER